MFRKLLTKLNRRRRLLQFLPRKMEKKEVVKALQDLGFSGQAIDEFVFCCGGD